MNKRTSHPRGHRTGRQYSGADLSLDPTQVDVALTLRQMTEGRGADVTIEASGSYAALQEAVRTAAPNTTVTAMGFYSGNPAAINLGAEFHHNRVTIKGSLVDLTGPDLSATHSFARQVGYEVHSDGGSLYLSSWHNYDATVCFRKYGDKTGYRDIPLIREPFAGPKKVEWCRGVNDFATAIRDNTAAMVQGEHAAHVIEAILAAQESARSQRPVKVESTFTPPVLKD